MLYYEAIYIYIYIYIHEGARRPGREREGAGVSKRGFITYGMCVYIYIYTHIYTHTMYIYIYYTQLYR